MEKFKKTFLWLGALSLCCGTISADDNIDYPLQDLSAEQQTNPADAENRPYKISAFGDWIGNSKIDKKGYHHQSVKFYIANVQAEAVVYYNPHCEEGISLGLGYTRSRFDWNKNRFFKTKDMDQVSVTLSGFSKRLQDWQWLGYLTATFEPRYSNLSEYTNYDIMMWGRYTCTDIFNMHIGFLAQTGMKMDNIYPIIGFDWVINDKWKLNAVYPMNMSLVYTINCNWSAAAAIRIFDLRYRFGKHQRVEKALLHYRNNGLELALNYNKGDLSANVHAGGTFGGRFKIANKHYKHRKHFDLDSAAYAGAEASLKF